MKSSYHFSNQSPWTADYPELDPILGPSPVSNLSSVSIVSSRYKRTHVIQTQHRQCVTENTSCDCYPLLLCDVTVHAQAARTLHSNSPCMDAKKTLPQYCWQHVRCRHCLAVDLHVTIDLWFSFI
jgi:hypothetical protein